MSKNNLDPINWSTYRKHAHELLDTALDHVENSYNRPVWKPVPQALKDKLKNEPLPMQGETLETLGQFVSTEVMPYSTGNTHPSFFGWVHGTGTAGGVVAEMLSAAMNSNCGGREHSAVYIERQVIEWFRQIFGFSDQAGGLLTSGTSMGTLLAISAARRQSVPNIAEIGMTELPKPLALYVSAQAHNSVKKAATALGFGKNSLRLIEIDKQGSIVIDALKSAIAKDQQAGVQPLCIIGNAGTVNTGAFDDISKLADVAETNNIWLHIDGAFGGLTILSDTHKHLVNGIERAHSVAFDFHKWLHVPYAVGCLLVRDKQWQLDAFSDRPDYLAEQERGIGAGSPWFCEMGLELSRGFGALKVWMTIKEHGLTRLGEMISKNCVQARHLAKLAEDNPQLELLAPVASNICNLRFNPKIECSEETLDKANTEIVLRLQESGIAAPSTTKINGRTSIRVNITNHRTELSDIELLVEVIIEEGCQVIVKSHI